MSDKTVNFKLKGTDDTKAATSSAAKNFSGLGKEINKGFKDLGKELGLSFGLATVVGAMKDFAVASVQAARESATATAQLDAVLKSTGGAAGVTKGELSAMASELQKVSMFSDEAVMGGQSLLLTFTNIGSSVFPAATQTILDMSQALGQDLKSSAIQLGKALNDPVAGISALSRVGVTFSESQKQQIQTMMEANNIAGAQQVILAELNKEFGGSAVAARDAAGGAQDLAVSYGDLQEEVGGLILKLGDAGATGAAVGWMDQLAAGAAAWSSAIENIKLLSEANARLTEELSLVEQAQQGAIGQVDRSGNAYKLAESGLSSLIGWFVEGTTEQEGFVQAVQEVAAATSTTNAVIANTPARINPALQAIRTYAASLRDLAKAQQSAQFAPQTNREADAYRQLAMARTGQVESLAAFQNKVDQERIDEQRQAESQAAEERQKSSEEAADAMSQSFEKAADNIRSTIESVIQPSLDEVWKPPEGSEVHIDEAARRMATVATSGFGSEWLAQLSGQFAGQDFFKPITDAMASGDEGALKAAANEILTNSVTKLWDPEVIKEKVRAQLQEAQLREQLIAQIQQELSAEGMEVPLQSVAAAAGDVSGVAPAVATGISGIGQAATDATLPLTNVQTALTDLGISFGSAQGPLAEFVGQLGEKLTEASGTVSGFKTAVTEIKWEDVGKAIVAGISKGIQDNLDKVRTTLKNLAMEAIAAAKAELGIASPSKAFGDMGREIIAGLVGSVTGGIPDFQNALDKLLNLKNVGTGFMDAFGQARDDIEKSLDKWMPEEKVEFALRAMSKALKGNLEFASTATNAQLEDMLMNAVGSWSAAGISNPQKMVEQFVGIFRQTQKRLGEEAGAAGAANFQKMLGGVGQFAGAANQEADALNKKIAVLNTLLRKGGNEFAVEGQIVNAVQAQERLNQLIAEQTGMQGDLAGIQGLQQGLQNLQEQQGLMGLLGAPVDQAAGDIVGGLADLTGFLGQQIMAALTRNPALFMSPAGAGGGAGTGTGRGGNTTVVNFNPTINTTENQESILSQFYLLMSMLPSST